MEGLAAETQNARSESSEPHTTRSKPYDEDDGESSSRKRQRLEHSSRDPSVDTELSSSDEDLTMPNPSGQSNSEPSSSVYHPQRRALPELASDNMSSKMTINLRLTKGSTLPPTSIPTPGSPSQTVVTAARARPSIEHDSQNETTEGTSTPTDSSESPPVELIVDDADDMMEGDSGPHIAIIEDDLDSEEENQDDGDPYESFPLFQEAYPGAALRRVIYHFENEIVTSQDVFVKLRGWMHHSIDTMHHFPELWQKAYKMHEEFWELIPDAILSLFRRTVPFGEFMFRASSQDAISEYFRYFAKLTAHIVAIDSDTLGAQASTIQQMPTLPSRRFLRALNMLLRASETHLGNLLDLQYGFSWPPVVESVVKGFLRDCEGIDNLTQYVARVLAFSDSEPSLADDLAVICRVVQYVLNREIALGESSLREARSQSRLQEIYEFHEVFAARLDSIIMRSGSHFTTDSASVCITVLYTILHITCSIPDSPAAAALSDYHKENPRLSGEQVCIALPYVWKLRALFTLIKCPQMQLRVFAATAMCRELVTFFNKLTPTPGADHSATHPLHAHIADFLHNENVVGYIVGSASHPEIIRHSQDVVGFLIATGTYRNKETDTIWAAVMDRQDSTLIEGLLQYLKYVAKSLDLAGLSYLCGKFMTLPSRAFSPSMRDVVMQCFTSLQKRCSDEGLPLPALPFEVCIRVIQETSQCFEHGISEVVDSQKWACQVLGDLNQYGPSDDDRQRLYSLLTQDIASKSTALSGSICALAKLLQHNSMSDLPALTAQYDLVGVLVDSLGHVSHDTTLSASSSLEQPIMRARHEFLLHIILKQPNTLLSPVGRRLWDTLVAAEDQSISAKEVAWKTLIMASKSEPQNAYLKLAFQEFLPELKPRHFTSGALTFTQTMVHDYLRHSFQATDDDVGQDTSGIEELWRMALTAPSASIEQRAISALVDLYFEGPLIQSRSLELVRSNHMKFVRRCIQQLAIAADMLQQLEHSSEGRRSDAKAPLDGAPLDESGAVLQEVIKFERSLELLTQFMKRYETWQAPQSGTRSRQQFSSPVNEEGEEIVIKYQAFEDQKHGPTCAISVGAGNTLMNLFNVIETATGFENFKVFHWGTEMSLQTCDPESLVVDHAIHQGLLLVVKRSGRWTDVIGHLGENSISEEVLSHFTDFRAYLGMRTTVAKAVYQFLISIPMSPKLSMALEQTHPDLDDILPVGQPFMCLYSIHGMQELLQSRKRQGLCDTNFLDRLLRLTISAISKKDFFDACDDSALRISMAQSLLDCLGQILQNTVPGPVPNPSFNEALLDSLFALNGISQLLNQDRSRQRLMSSVFDVLLEISFQNQTFLSAFNRHENTPLLLSALLLESSAPSIRKSTLKQLGKRCGQGQSPISASHHAMSLALWPLLYDLIPKSFVLPNQSEETFSAAILVFRNLAGSLGERYLQQQCFVRWCQFLLDHQSTEELYVGYPQDSVAKGLAHLAYLCTCFIKAPDTWLTQQKLGSELFKAHLFPPHSYATDVLGTGHTPILTSVTRNYIYDIVLYLTRLDRGQFIEVLALMSPLTTYDASNKRDPYRYPLPLAFDRTANIRSSCRYPGIQNLSNTCYLNSLCSQLFMNPSFRSFILELPDTLDEGLLFETQALFANMQKSLVRHVDPSNFVSSIRTYDNTDIDVTAQMDVEEFYNLLFDRLEAQLLTIDAKRRFKSLYGGELIQQIKSKECVHVSERFEPFSAIQCDIKGKNNLAESLYAYVNGEVMEGDNKYKCSSCDRHVNAVRRACLKQVPDNLIFHLKRFDFNLQNMERNKINDYFAFPQRLDMRPYKMEYLNNPSADIPEDDFELVGILVHAGSAEMGHYYSYVRERPSSGTMPKWMEFNDEQVTSFDSATIGENCFGGVSQVAESQGFPMEKPFSAYMLFYERASVLRQEQGDYHALSSPRKFEVKLPGHLDEEIMTRNAMLLQRHCLFDPVHAAFALRLMNKCHTEASSARGANHNLEDATLEAILASLDHFVSRAKGIPTFPDYIALLNQRLHTCRACCLTFLEWFVEHPEALRQLLIRNPEQSVRGTIANLIGMVLRKLKDTYLHHQSASQSSMLLAVERLVDVLASFWMTCPQGMKTWTEYFTLLVHIASLGEQELAMLFEAEFLTKVLGALTYDAASNQNMATRLSMFTHKRLNAKYGSQTPAVSLLAILLENSTVDLHVEEDYPASSSSNNDFRLAADDIELLLLETQDRVNSVIDRILSFNQKIPVVRSVTSFMLRKLGDTTFGIYNAIRFGIQKSLRSTCSTPIDAALAFCESAQDVERIKKLVHHIVRFTLGIDHTEGRQLARFFSCVSERVSKNSSLPQIEVLQFIMEQIPNWAPFLLDYPDTETRRITADSIRRVLFAPDFATQMPSEEAESHAYLDTTTIIKLLGVRCLKRMEDEYVQPRVTAIKRNVSEIMDILEACRPYYETESTETLDLQFENLSHVVSKIKQSWVEVEREDTSYWSDDGFESSSPMIHPVIELDQILDSHDMEDDM